ncbi:MAG TPA: cytidine deaminase [archaeon]|nr:cytidine deaminase [archaeon]
MTREVSDAELLAAATRVARKRPLTKSVEVGDVGCALVSVAGNVYVGASIKARCGLGICSENSAIAAMVTAGENVVRKIIAVHSDGSVLPSCGRCRELLSQIAEENKDALLFVAQGKANPLKELLPDSLLDAPRPRK